MPMKSILTQLEERGEVALSRAGKEKGRERGEIQLEMTVLSLSVFPHFFFLITLEVHMESGRGCMLTVPPPLTDLQGF